MIDLVSNRINEGFECLVFQQQSHQSTISGYLRQGIFESKDYNIALTYSKDNFTISRYIGPIIDWNTCCHEIIYFFRGEKYNLDTWDFDKDTGVETIALFRNKD